ncbi:hypothetical protein H4R19_003601 [Coemansia spiralis]|nr:hypothetical protein H4R19_003601 [Coemansia spiralis]
MATVFPKHLHPDIFPEGNDNDDSDAPGLTGNTLPISNERSQKILSVTVRMLFYSLVPIVTQAWVLAANMLTHCPMWLYVLANLIPATQGMINLLVFTINPAWDDYRHWLVNRYGRLRAKGHGVAKIGCAGNTHGLETEAPRSPTLLDK